MIIRILIADDHGVVAEGLRALLDAQPDMQVVALAGNGREAVRRSVELNPDVVVMDSAMPVLNGTEAARIIRKRCVLTRVVMLSMHSDEVHVRRALQAGARGYIVKKSAAEDAVNAIRTVHRGQRYLSKPLADGLIDHVLNETPQDPLERVSARERQVLQLLAEGNSIAAIAHTLSLSPKTVETYRARMMEKLELDGFASLIKFAIRQGVTSLE